MAITTNNGKKGGTLKGKPHSKGGIKAVVTDTDQPVELEGGEVIINKKASKKHWRELSRINQSAGGGVPILPPSESYAKGGVITYRHKYNLKYGYNKNDSHNLRQVAKDTGYSLKGLQQIYNKGIGAYKNNPQSVRPNVKSKEQWAMARVYSAVMGGKASRIDKHELALAKGGGVGGGRLNSFAWSQYTIGKMEKEFPYKLTQLNKILKKAVGNRNATIDNFILSSQSHKYDTFANCVYVAYITLKDAGSDSVTAGGTYFSQSGITISFFIRRTLAKDEGYRPVTFNASKNVAGGMAIYNSITVSSYDDISGYIRAILADNPPNKLKDDVYGAGGGIPERYKKMGFEKIGQKKQSTNPEKKWMVLAKKGDQYKVVHGGYKGMEDYTQHGDKKRRERFWNRMGGRDSAKANDPFSPLYWHKKFGTWAKGGELARGVNEEQEHKHIAEKLYRRELKPNQAALAIAKDHLKEDKFYYTKLALAKLIMKMNGKFVSGGNLYADGGTVTKTNQWYIPSDLNQPPFLLRLFRVPIKNNTILTPVVVYAIWENPDGDMGVARYNKEKVKRLIENGFFKPIEDIEAVNRAFEQQKETNRANRQREKEREDAENRREEIKKKKESRKNMDMGKAINSFVSNNTVKTHLLTNDKIAKSVLREFADKLAGLEKKAVDEVQHILKNLEQNNG